MRGIAAALQTESAHQPAEPARTNDHVRFGHAHIFDRIVCGVDPAKAHQLLALAELHAGRVLLEQNRADAFRARFIIVAAIGDVIVRMPAAAGPAFIAVDDIVITIGDRAGLEVGKCRSRVWLGHRDGDHFLAFDNFGQDARLHFLRTEAFDGAYRPDQRLENRESDCIGDLRKLFQHQQRFEVSQPKAAIFGRQVHTQKAHLAIFAHHVARDRIVLRFHIARQLGQFGAGKFARGLLQLALIVG